MFCTLLATCQFVRADLLITTGELTDLTLDVFGFTGDSHVSRTLGISFSLFGNSLSSVYVSENGNLTNLTDSDFYPKLLSLPNVLTGMRIAPLWDDFEITHLNQVYEQKVAGEYYSVTWKDVSLSLRAGTTLSTQVVLFGAAKEINGFQFQPNDIVFSYENVLGDFGGLVAEAGLRNADGTNFFQVPIPRIGPPAQDGEIGFIPGNSALANLPLGYGEFVLLRPTANGTYEYITAVPEPSSIALVLGALIPLGFRAAHKRRQANKLAR